MRFGTRTDLKRRWTPQGHRPKAPQQIGYQFSYLYLAICPFSGQAFAMLLPQMSKECFSLFLEAFNEELSQKTLLILDKASTHQAQLAENTQLVLQHLPTACPELNVVERFFKEVRKQLANMIFPSLEYAEQKLTHIVEQLTQNTDKLIQLTLFPYLRNAQ